MGGCCNLSQEESPLRKRGVAGKQLKIFQEILNKFGSRVGFFLFFDLILDEAWIYGSNMTQSIFVPLILLDFGVTKRADMGSNSQTMATRPSKWPSKHWTPQDAEAPQVSAGS